LKANNPVYDAWRSIPARRAPGCVDGWGRPVAGTAAPPVDSPTRWTCRGPG